MTVTDTVSSFAKDAAVAAEDLGKQAIVLGRAAAAAGSDVAASAATHASHLAKDVKKKVPTAKELQKRLPSSLPLVSQKRKKSRSWKLWVALGVVALATAAAYRMKRAQTSSRTSHTPTSAQSATTRHESPSTVSSTSPTAAAS